jgi:hypothetical protein
MRFTRSSGFLTRLPRHKSECQAKAVVEVRHLQCFQTNQTVTRITGVTKFSQRLISMLTILWVVVSSRLQLVLPRFEGGFARRFLRRLGLLGPSLIKYLFADRIARWSPCRPAASSVCWTPPLDISGANCKRLRERGLNFLHALDPLSDISCRTGTPRQRWRGLWLNV